MKHACAISILTLAGCMRVTVVGSGSGVHGTPKPADCAIPFFRAPPADPYDELGTLHLETRANDPARALDALREKACALGADAVVITQEFTRIGDSAVMKGTALRYRGTPADPLHPLPSSL